MLSAFSIEEQTFRMSTREIMNNQLPFYEEKVNQSNVQRITLNELAHGMNSETKSGFQGH